MIVSFIGNTDFKFFPPRSDGQDCSPILRLLLGMSEFEPYIPPARTRLLLFDDDRDGKTERRSFCERLQQALPELGLGELRLERRAIVLPEGPTDLNALYEGVWGALPTAGLKSVDEVLFHLASGTPAMQLTLLLAAHCRPLDNWRLVETSREQGVREVRPPYVLAAREIHGRGALPRTKLTEQARRSLLPDTVIDDPLVATRYAELYKAAKHSKIPQRLLVRGPVGSGKWHACRQFARWRGAETAQWLDQDNMPDLPEGATLLIRHLDVWPEPALQSLTRLAAERPDLAIAASFRTDLPPAAPLAVLAREGLRGAAHVELPALGARPADVVALGEALARQLGLLDGKLKERLQYELLTDVYPRNLHDLKSLLATAAVRSPGAHPKRSAFVQAKEITNTNSLLAEAWQILSGMDFGQDRHRLDDVLEVIRAAVVRRALADGRSQKEAGTLLGMSQQTVAEILKKQLDLRGWQTPTEDLDDHF
ncbi:MAG: hypothetical protein L0099_15065 [Acidobacteria bacterium]|nr:hypothetical protein [Acidobacteriota bacterium]